MSTETETFSCPGCGGHVAFDIPSGQWRCAFCSLSCAKDELESRASGSAPASSLNEVICWACGAQLVCEDTTAATFCVYCRNPAIVKSRFSGDFKPRYVLPFVITQDQAKKLYFAWIRKRFFAPASFKKKQEIDNIRGLYVPCWLFDAQANGHIEGEGRDRRSYTSGDYDVTETSYYRVVREGVARYSRVPVDGSKKLDDSLVLGIEPFDYSKLADFSPEYMAATMAECYDLSANEAQGFMETRVKDYLAASLAESGRRYDSFSLQHQDLGVGDVKAEYAMVPLYILTNRHGTRNCMFLVNGQTGKVYGQTPVDHLGRFLFTLALGIGFSILALLVGGIFNVR